ncbi:hypothetical protein HCDG_07904 [Histoplasma capsulatum H143]|uniref:Uncharacterized protein n=1 Tax=Ajellomyces capsulatus (strain H143) TaxID=544712 RepID=C6HNX3_AJECH|nr:hypothetical protein HCDG_07904 [Histoplasma capsulatum H143]
MSFDRGATSTLFEEVSEFAQAVADLTCCKSSNTVEVYREAVNGLGINEDVEKFINNNRITLLDHFRKIRIDIQPVLTSLRDLDFNRINQNLREKTAVDDEIKNTLVTLEDLNPDLLSGTPEKLVNEIGNIHTWIWRVLEQIDGIEVLDHAENAFRRLIDRKLGLVDCINEFDRLLESAVKRYTPERPFPKSQDSSWRPGFNQSLLILSVMLLLLDPLALSGITARITEVIKQFDDDTVIRHPNEYGGWDRIASFIRKQFPKAMMRGLKEQLDYLIAKLNRVTGTLDQGSKTSQKTPFTTNWLLLCAHGGVFVEVPGCRITDEHFDYSRREC